VVPGNVEFHIYFPVVGLIDERLADNGSTA
jgi:hypothetical protein